ncbi:MAG: hypothetical protein ACXWDJ_10535 [Aeromicrobium sp.]
MSSGGALRWVACHLPGMNDEVRADLVETIGRTAHRASRRDRVAETVSLVGFALQSSSRRGTGDHRAQMFRQGARIAALALVATFTATAWSQGAVFPALAGATAVVLVSAGLRWTAVAPCIAAVFGAANTSAELLALGVVVLVVVAIGEPFDRTFCPIGGLLGGLGVAVGAGTTAFAPDIVLPVVDGAGLVVLVMFLLVGWADPRFAVAATIVCASRFVTTDVAELIPAIEAAATQDEIRLVLARWALMGVGVSTSWWLTRAALARCLTVHR